MVSLARRATVAAIWTVFSALSLGSCQDPALCDGKPCSCGCEGIQDGNPCTTYGCDEEGACKRYPSPAGTVCRAKKSPCDIDDFCDGVSEDCPEDLYDPMCECPQWGPLDDYPEHGGLRAIDSTNFVLQDTDRWASNTEHFDALKLDAVSLAALPLDRSAQSPSGALATALGGMVAYSGGFEWDSEDQSAAYWVPQGITIARSGGTKRLLVSWYYDESQSALDPAPPEEVTDKGVRVSFVDIGTLAGSIAYTHVLLVRYDSKTVLAPITLRSGGIAWQDPYLYIAETGRGVRVFDTGRILNVSTSAGCATKIGKIGDEHCAFGHAYVLPQLGAYYYPGGLSESCQPPFSFISVDTSSTPPAILSGEYVSYVTVGQYSRLLRWPLDPETGRLVTSDSGAVTASQAFYAGNRSLQGAAALGDKMYLSSIRYTGSLATAVLDEPNNVYKFGDGDWISSPEGIHIEEGGILWTCSRGDENTPRVVFSAPALAIP